MTSREWSIILYKYSMWLWTIYNNISIKLLNFHTPFRSDWGPHKMKGRVVVYIRDMFQIISFYLEVSIVAIPLPDYPSLDQNDESHLYYPLCKQLIDTPTHFTEHSSSLIDLFMTNNVNYCYILRSWSVPTRSHTLSLSYYWFF
jgi:hypothetical protein